jgi:hypothetical protein
MVYLLRIYFGASTLKKIQNFKICSCLLTLILKAVEMQVFVPYIGSFFQSEEIAFRILVVNKEFQN